MIIKWAGRDYRYDVADITTHELKTIREHTGLGLRSWDNAIRELDERAVEALAWVIRKHNGDDADISTVDVPLLGFMAAYNQAMEAGEKAKPPAPKAPRATARSARPASSSAPPTT